MEVHINKTHGLRNDLLVVIPRREIEDVHLHIANRNRLMELPGLLRHVSRQDPEERRMVGACKVPVEEHLRLLTQSGRDLMGPDGRPKRPIVAIGCRNVGNNHGFVAWQKDQAPRLFHVRGDPLNYPHYTCLVRPHASADLTVRDLNFSEDRVLEDGVDVSARVGWCVYANRVLRRGEPVEIDEIIGQFYDIRHVLAFDRQSQEGKQIEAEIFEGYPGRFRENAMRLWRERGIPRNRFLHNCLGLSEDKLFILQREGTIEEVTAWLREAGARDGLILDNGASPFCWMSWLYPKGGYLFTAPDYRPNASAVLMFVLKGPAATVLPGGSVSFSVV